MVREYRPPGSVRGAPGNRCPYLDKAEIGWEDGEEPEDGGWDNSKANPAENDLIPRQAAKPLRK